MENASIMKFYQINVSPVKRRNIKKQLTLCYNDWKAQHLCSIIHTGSAGAMEVVGGQKMFGRSVNFHGLRYTFYIGDGDTKSFDQICKSDPYAGHTIAKEECVGHVQKKELVPRLRNVKSQYKGKKCSLTAKVSVAVKDA